MAYIFAEKHHQDKLIEVKSYDSNKREVEEQKSNSIIFILEGRTEVRLNFHPFQTIGADEFFFVPAGFMIEWNTIDNLLLLVIHPESLVNISSILKIEKRYEASLKCGVGNTEDSSFIEELGVLKTNRHIRSYVLMLKEYIEDGLDDVRLLNIKINEFLFLVSALYSLEEIRAFFHSIASPDILFAEYVRYNYSRHKTIKELAGAMNITQAQFSVKFKNVFGTSPYQWIIHQKIAKIRWDIIENKKTNKEIALDNGFNNPQQFYDFCRIQIGLTPTQIREEYINKIREECMNRK